MTPGRARPDGAVRWQVCCVRRFLEAVCGSPWPRGGIILLPLDGTPEVVRDHVETNRARTQKRIEHLVGVAVEQADLPKGLDVELVAQAIRCLGEEAGRRLLTDPERYSPERYAEFVTSLMALVWPLKPASN